MFLRASANRVADTVYDSASDEGYYPGLVNISGTYCFMNSTLQVRRDLPTANLSLMRCEGHGIFVLPATPAREDTRQSRSIGCSYPRYRRPPGPRSPSVHSAYDVYTSDILSIVLNNPSSSSRAIRPMDIIGALSAHNPGKHNSLFSSREHQDAQELFQLLSECIKSETVAVAKEIRRDRGLGGLAQKDDRTSRDLSKTVFDGLTANRRSCMDCGYTEAVMHFPFDNWQLALPRMAVRYL